MKKSIMIPLAIFLFTLFVASFAMAETEVIPSYAMPIMETWNASTSEELRLNIIASWREFHAAGYGEAEANEVFNPDQSSYQVKICFDKTTEELIANPESWNLAITSSKNVNLQKLVEKDLIGIRENHPSDPLALHLWLLPEKVQNMLSIYPSPYQNYEIFCYSYNEQTEEAILLLCKKVEYNARICRPDSGIFAETILSHRSVEDIRALEGVVNERYPKYEDLMKNPQAWDTALLCDIQDNQIDMLEQLDILDQAGLLYDFAQEDYWKNRDVDWPYLNHVMNDSGKMIAIPIWSAGDRLRVMVINPQSLVVERALEYTKHFVKTYEWAYENMDMPREHVNKYGYSIHRDEMDW